MTLQDAAACLGARVRELRLDRGLTLKALGRQAGLSHPFLSQLERGLARPSVSSVERIAGALDVSVSTLWDALPRIVQPPSLVRSDEAPVTPHPDAPGGVRELSAGALRVREWSGGARGWPESAETTLGQVFLYVVRGSVEVDLDGSLHQLAAGDALRFDGTVPHRLRRSGAVTTRLLYVAVD